MNISKASLLLLSLPDNSKEVNNYLRTCVNSISIELSRRRKEFDFFVFMQLSINIYASNMRREIISNVIQRSALLLCSHVTNTDERVKNTRGHS